MGCKSGKGAIIVTLHLDEVPDFSDFPGTPGPLPGLDCCNATYPPIPVPLYLALACLVLVWAGVASAEEAYESAAELVEHVQVDQVAQGGVEPDTPEPQDCPAFVSGFALPVLFLLEVRPDGALPEFPSVFPRATSPPPRRS